MVKVKICGITNWTDARRAVEAGADFLGFNFYPPSPRYIPPAKARKIVRRLPKQVTIVGVFVNAPEEKILAIARSVGLDYLQLHGEESPTLISRLKRSYPVIKAVRVRNSFRPAQLVPFKRAAEMFREAGGKLQGRGTAGEIMEERIELGAKMRVGLRGCVGLLELLERSDKSFRNVAAAIGAVASAGIGDGLRNGAHGRLRRAVRTARMRDLTRAGSFFPGFDSTPLQISTA